jgi:hypothetical protein
MIEVVAIALAVALVVVWGKVTALEKRCELLVKAIDALVDVAKEIHPDRAKSLERE